MTSGLHRCRRCGATLGPWEKSCRCEGPAKTTIRESIYAIACAAPQALHARDYVRLAEHDHGLLFSEPTAFVTLSTDSRFCWSGRGLYGLYRHGPLPGPRNLEEATRLVLVSSGRALSPSLVDFCLKRFGYRYSVQSLRNAVGRSAEIYRENGFWDHARGDDAEWDLLHDFDVLPEGEWDAWDPLKADIRRRVTRCADEMKTRLATAADLRHTGLDWAAMEGDEHMAKKGGSLPRGRRTPEEVPAVPEAGDLSPLDARAQSALLALVEQAGGRFGSTTAIPVGHIAVLTDLLDAWGRRYATSHAGGLYFGGQPGLWHALDQLCPLQDPNRWDQLRRAIVIELERTRGWRRREPPRGIAFDIGI